MPAPVPIRVPVVHCKRCTQAVSTSSSHMPEQAVIVDCPLCHERRQYRPSEVFLGSPSYRARVQALTLVR